ncbi:MAG: hypothetical protein ACM3SR_09720 [Ignavibacteriales bacterium]
MILIVGVLLPVLVLVAVGAATYPISQGRAECNRICEMPEAKQLDWLDLKHRRLVTLMGHLSPIAASVGFLLAWVIVLIKMRTAQVGPARRKVCPTDNSP